MTRTIQQKENGFTLVELAISLMIIGLLLGGVLKGQELIENARITAVARQFKSFEAAMNTFRSTYGSLPGDIVRVDRIPNCTTSPCNLRGNGDNTINSYGGTPTVYGTWDYTNPGAPELRNFWFHMAKAGMISGVDMNGGTSSPFQWGVEFPAGPINDTGFLVNSFALSAPYPEALIPVAIVYMAGAQSHTYGSLNGPQAAALDIKMDDGKPYSGDMVSPMYPTSCTTAYAANGRYAETNIDSQCTPLLLLK